jgi:uncharacterized protein YgbK (DUF1537 family)
VAVEWVIQADDLTGAADTAVGFAAAGLRTLVLPWRGAAPGTPPDAAVLAFDTASRDLDAGTAADRAGRVAHWFAGHCDDRAWMYKKVDSTLRGNPAAELSAVERALCAAGRCPSQVVVAPAFPALGRTTVDGHQRWDGEAIDVARLLGPADDARVKRVVVDARRTEDLEALAARLEALPERPLLVGSGGLAAAHAARRQGPPPAATRPPEVGPVLVVSGSRTPLATRQADVLGRRARSLTRVALDEAEEAGSAAARALVAGGDVLLTGPDASTADVAGSLGRAAARALRTATPRLVIAVGGDTAHALCTALGVESLRAEREAAPGAPLLRCTLSDGRVLRLVLKSGSFGEDEMLARLVACA